MREGKTDFKGKFYVGQSVRVDFTKMDVDIDNIACDTGVIRHIHGQFLRTPDLARIVYDIRFDKPPFKKTIFPTTYALDVEGELLLEVQ